MGTNGNHALEDLVHWRGELADLVKAARHVDASATALVDRAAITVVLEKVADGQVGLDELTTWAQTVHFVDGLHIEDGHEDLLTQFLFETSTPELFEPVTSELCHRWQSRVQSSLAISPVVGRWTTG
ncbi:MULTISPECIES: hypothetical protein [unclassified Streptomyces]|uniref:hypothetical protein n=1 Tax=unclassified Streptomyces TaxID=2593676 RepID=UPI0020240CC9|nr:MULTISPECIES: hypothetical protein [unclassified Streptomyces]WSC20560.1 hypothetical protein OIE60_13155 [Streptomyces sp. NBC_01766]WSV54591.1 hypothetical protein OG282_13215 [Streptomyces sp. NBC_01014]